MRTLVIGGASSGKSEYAEELAIRLPQPRFYVATMKPCDEEDWQRIEKHRAMRAEKGFVTIERYTDLETLKLPDRGTVLLECLGNLAANELFSPEGGGEDALGAVIRGIDNIEAQCDNLVVVSNDIFCGGYAYAGDTVLYIDIAADVNKTLSGQFEHVVEIVCGIPLTVKEAGLS